MRKEHLKNLQTQNKTITAVKNVSMRIRHGETVALVGRSGSGKSTLAHILAGFLESEKGDVFFNKKSNQWPLARL